MSRWRGVSIDVTRKQNFLVLAAAAFVVVDVLHFADHVRQGRALGVGVTTPGTISLLLAIARALALEPKVMLFDEPTSALDPELVGEVLETMKRLATVNHMTMVCVTHEVGFAREVGDRAVLIDGGVIVEDAPPAHFFESPQHERTRQFLSKIL